MSLNYILTSICNVINIQTNILQFLFRLNYSSRIPTLNNYYIDILTLDVVCPSCNFRPFLASS